MDNCPETNTYIRNCAQFKIIARDCQPRTRKCLIRTQRNIAFNARACGMCVCLLFFHPLLSFWLFLLHLSQTTQRFTPIIKEYHGMQSRTFIPVGRKRNHTHHRGNIIGLTLEALTGTRTLMTRRLLLNASLHIIFFWFNERRRLTLLCRFMYRKKQTTIVPQPIRQRYLDLVPTGPPPPNRICSGGGQAGFCLGRFAFKDPCRPPRAQGKTKVKKEV